MSDPLDNPGSYINNPTVDWYEQESIDIRQNRYTHEQSPATALTVRGRDRSSYEEPDMQDSNAFVPWTSPAKFWPRFWGRVERCDSSGCWQWIGAKNQGYGKLRSRGRTYKAHRVAYEALIGPIPDGMVIDHLCRNRCCVNPAHLEPVTPVENTLRGANSVKTHCPHGHEYTEENTAVYQRSGEARGKYRACRTCARFRARVRAQEMRAA